jgi:hypothetical protein
MDKPHRNKGKGKSPSHCSNPWYSKLGYTLTDIRDMPSELNPSGAERCHVAFLLAEWDISMQTLCLIQLVPRSVFLRPIETFSELTSTAVRQIQGEAKLQHLPVPTHIWTWCNRNNQRLRSMPEKLGFVEKREYFLLHPEVEGARFDFHGFEPLYDNDNVVMITSVGDFMGVQARFTKT